MNLQRQPTRPTGSSPRYKPAVHVTLAPGVSRRQRPTCGTQRTVLRSAVEDITAPVLKPAAPSIERLPLFMTESGDEGDSAADGGCEVFEDREGQLVEVMCCDYGWRSGAQRVGTQNDGIIPESGVSLALNNFKEELVALRRSFRSDEYATISQQNPASSLLGKAGYALGKGFVRFWASVDQGLESVGILPKLTIPAPNSNLTVAANATMSECLELRRKLKLLKLSNVAVWARERLREDKGVAVKTPWYVKGAYLALCTLLDVLFNNRPIQRFWFLETVARMPYFSYIACLHLYESLGWWRAGAELRKIHFAEEWNELHHLQIMESLGGDSLWQDRFFAYHSAIIYFWVLIVLFFFSPKMAYNFSELIEAHAVDTYGEFAAVNEKLLKSLPPPLVALQYYQSNDLYLFDEFQTEVKPGARSPPTKNLYDVFINIRDDEGEHVKTMNACQDNSVVTSINDRKEERRRL